MILVQTLVVKEDFLQLLGKIFQKKLLTIDFSLYQNELPFRDIFKSIDRTTRTLTTFAGPLEKLCGSNL